MRCPNCGGVIEISETQGEVLIRQDCKCPIDKRKLYEEWKKNEG